MKVDYYEKFLELSNEHCKLKSELENSTPNAKIQELIDSYKYNAKEMGVNDTAGNELLGVAYDLEKLIGDK